MFSFQCPGSPLFSICISFSLLNYSIKYNNLKSELPSSKLLQRLKSKFQGRRKHLKSGGARSKKGHMATPINGQNSKMFGSIPNEVHIVFGRELKIIDFGVYLKTAISYRKFQR